MFWKGAMDLKEVDYLDSGDDNSLTGSETKRTLDRDMEERDEIKEIQRLAQADTSRVRTWRLLMLTAILATAITVTLTTYNFLKDEQRNDFIAGFHELASTVEASTLDQQRNIREGFEAMANVLTGYAKTSNSTWPFVQLKYFESYGANLRRQTLVEAFWIAHRVSHEDKDAFIEYIDDRYIEEVDESFDIDPSTEQYFEGGQYQPYIHIRTENGFEEDIDRPEYFPLWQQSPPPFHYLLVNYNLQGVQDYVDVMNAGDTLKNETLFTRVRPYSAFTDKDHANLHSTLNDENQDHPHSFVFHPIHEEVADTESKIVGYVEGAAAWDTALRNVMPAGVRGIYAVIRNNCDQTFTYTLDGPEAYFLGNGDWHEPKYEHLKIEIDLMALHTHPDFATTPGHCMYSLTVYPGREFEAIYSSSTPEIFTAVVAATFMLMVAVFVVYDIFVQRRNSKLIHNAARSNAIVSSLFPRSIRDRLIGRQPDRAVRKASTLKSYMNSDVSTESAGGQAQESKPLADLFLETTVVFADIVGFTAWSSAREPSQVFTLLETMYASFDEVAKRRRVFKVETVGDCYVAATGIPDHRTDHALVAVRFARDILVLARVVAKELAVSLGPDTGDLSLRIGVHSGPVTAGVLRGERARFQLFGDTMNTTARIESAGAAGRVHLSQDTADLLVLSGKSHWLIRRKDVITAKGKGDMQTYWLTGADQDELDPSSTSASTVGSSDDQKCSVPPKFVPLEDDPSVSPSITSERAQRLIDWNVATLKRLIQEIVVRRTAREVSSPSNPQGASARNLRALAAARAFRKADHHKLSGATSSPLQEVKEIITLPEFDQVSSKSPLRAQEVELDEYVVDQLQHYVTCVANMYRDNAFHNFEHATHVTMSVTKLLSRIVAPTDLIDMDIDDSYGAATLHDHTYGITSDPLTQFACAFSALIHDVDHVGVPNAELIKEQSTLATVYGNRSVAEQNSVVLAWELLCEPQFADLRCTICDSVQELRRFRELVVNGVMATDIADKDLKALRNGRWDKAFFGQEGRSGLAEPTFEESPRAGVNRKATIVIEHLIQASDVAHTMQHWHVYRKWNELFFRECYTAYLDGRAEKDPSSYWYKGEIGFFDFYIIPLARKLKDCGVFGKSSDEYLNYAMKNRAEWESRGQEVVAEMIETVCRDKYKQKKNHRGSTRGSSI